MKYKAQVNLDNLNNRVVADQCKNELDVKLRSLPNISDNMWKDIAQAINDPETQTSLPCKWQNRSAIQTPIGNETENRQCNR